ncbi:MAG: hypothetical protein Q8929_14820, partial [Bacillota bacterium]|nr:hypothetical protein [Bacillota bacterium]
FYRKIHYFFIWYLFPEWWRARDRARVHATPPDCTLTCPSAIGEIRRASYIMRRSICAKTGSAIRSPSAKTRASR